MALRNPKPVIWAPSGLTDALDGTEDFPGACNLESNLIPAQNQKGVSVARVAARAITAVLPDYAGGPITCLFTTGNMCYGMYASRTYPGQDRPFAYNMATGIFAPIAGLGSSNLPTSAPTTGAWTPPTAAQIGSRVLFTHPGFPGGPTANTFWLDSVGNVTNGSAVITGYPFYYGIPVGSLLSDNIGDIPAGATVVSQTIDNINVSASGTATDTYVTVASATGIYPGQPVFLPNGQWDTVASVSGTRVNLNNITISNNFSSTNITFATSTITMSHAATGSTTNLLIAATAPVYDKIGWLDLSGFSTSIAANIPATTQPIINGYFNVTGIQPGMTVTGPNIPAGTTVRAVGSLVFQVNMTTNTGSTAFSALYFTGNPSPGSYLAGTLQQGQQVAGPGLPTGTTFVTLSGSIESPYGNQISGSLSANAITGGTNQVFTVSSTFIILSQLPTGSVYGASFTIAGGTAAAPLWGAGDVQTLALANVPVWVREYGGSACYGVNTTNPQTAATVISDAGIPCQCTNASQVLTFGNAVPVTAGYGLPLENQLGGVIQSLIVFQGASNLQQITGTPALGNVTINTSQVATGTLAPNSVAATPKGLVFVAPDGLRLLDFSGVVHDPIGIKGDGVVNPFVCATQPSRIAASFSGNVYRVTVTWQPPAFLQTIYGQTPRTDDFWLHLDTMKFSGPHTCAVDLIQPWPALNSFICGLQQAQGQLWRSDPYPTPTSGYVENGVGLAWKLRTVLLPDDESDEANALVESSVWGSMSRTSSWAAALIDDQGQTQTTANVFMAAAAVTQSQLPIYWGAAAAFRQAAIQLTGPSDPQTLIGAMRLRYQKLRYPLPAFPSTFAGETFMATPAGANVLDYGADPTGTKDNYAAFQAALTASNLIVIPPGTYLFNEPFAFTIPASQTLQFVGSGAEASILAFAAGQNGFQATYGNVTSGLRLFGLTFATKGVGASTGLTLSQSAANGPVSTINILQDLVFRGFDAFSEGTDYWSTGISVSAWQVNYISCIFTSTGLNGTGVSIAGTSASMSIVHNFVGCSFWALNKCINYGQYAQGVTVTACNFTGVNYGIFNAASLSGCDQLSVSQSQFGYCYVAAIDLNSNIYDVIINGGNLFLTPPTGTPYACVFSNYENVIFEGNSVAGLGGTPNGIFFTAYGARASMVSGNFFTGMVTAVWLAASAQYVNVQSNCYASNTTNVLNSGSNNTVGGGSS